MVQYLFSLNLLRKSNNVKIKTHTLKRKNIVITSDKLTNKSFYLNVFNINNKYIISYCQNTFNYYNSEQMFIESIDGINFSEPKIYFKDYAASHNFSVFKDKDNKLKALGGIAHSKNHVYINIEHVKKMYGDVEYEKCKENVYPHIDNVKTMEIKCCDRLLKDGYGKCWIDPNNYSELKNNGLYLYELNNDGRFNLITKKPIISGLKPLSYEVKNAMKYNPINIIDSSVQCVYNENTKLYYLYMRANIGQGTRSIQYTISPDLSNWSDFKVIKYNPEFKYYDNYYSGEINLINNLFIGFPSFFRLRDEKLNMRPKIIISQNGDTFDVLDNIIEKKGTFCSNTFFEINNEYYFYVFENILTHNTILVRYVCKKDRLFSMNFPVQEQIIEFNKILLIENSEIKINFKTYNNGYIKFELLDIHKNIIPYFSFNDCEIIRGDSINYIIRWKTKIINYDKVYVRLLVSDCDLFTITGKFINE